MNVFLAAALAVSPPADGLATNIAETAAAMKSPASFDYDVTALASGVVRSIDGTLYIFLHDGTGDLFAMSRQPEGGLEAGDIVRVRGRHENRNASYSLSPLAASKAEKLGRSAPLPAIYAPLREIVDGMHDFVPVRTSGLVRDVAVSETSRKWTTLSLFDDGELLRVAVPLDAKHMAELSRLIGRHVEVTGFPNPTSGSPRKFAGRTLHCPGISAIRATDSGDKDPFESQGIETIVLKTAAQIAASGRVRASGRVICAWGGKQALVKTPDNDFVRIVCESNALPATGEHIECAGFPRTDAFHITLVRAQWRKAATPSVSDEDKTFPASAAAILGGTRVMHEFHGRKVRISGRIRNIREEEDGSVSATVEDGDAAFNILCSANMPADAVPGCTIEAVGTCFMEAKYWKPEIVVPQIRDMSLICSNSNDIRVIGHPPWWTTGRLMTLAGSLAAALFAVFAWNRSLTRLAERRGRRLLVEEIGRAKADLKAAERTRLAVELHDSLSQNLAGVSMELQTAERYGTANIAEMEHHIASASAMIKSCLNDMRNTLWDLRSQALDATDIESAVRRTLLPHVKGVTLAVDLTVPRSSVTEQELHDILHIIRELVLNGIRRGGARTVEISGRLEGDRLLFHVKDDGCGFDPASPAGPEDGHFGLRGIRDRLARHGGTIILDSAPGRGTTAHVELTMEQA